ncbi:N-acetyltransferase [Oceanobacillus arenosus]|uniref:N-acetyltransferase n=2 Tax=Oceanobacillus arenosus TaxID=1229153 RepID=A0A3D8PTN4_9BACI|nr:N-acetyltransferase [Oceanobacillus arenosus]
MSNPIIVEELDQDEIEIVRRVLVDSYQQYEDYYSPQGWKDYSKIIVSSIDNPNVDKILVAKLNNDILGSLQLFQSAETAYEKPELQIQAPIIRLLAVHPNARGRGVATELLKAVIENAEVLGKSNVYLHTTDFMVNAIQIYEKFGFVRDVSKDFSRNNILSKCYRFDIL